jgi:hypothetical protein
VGNIEHFFKKFNWKMGHGGGKIQNPQNSIELFTALSNSF